MKKDKFSKKIINILGVLLVIILFLFFLKDTMNFLIVKTNQILYPLQSKIYLFGRKIKGDTETILNYKDLIDENTDLKQKLMEKSLIEEKNEKLLEENERLRELLEMKGKFKYSFRTAKISFQQTRELYESFTINLGKKENMLENMPVLYEEMLIGKIDSVYDDYSIVQMITFQDNFVSARANNDTLGVIKGQRDENLIFEPISEYEAKINIGDNVYTSGISDIYPKGILIGKIYEIREISGNKKEYLIKEPSNILDMNEVIVLTEVEN